MRQLLLDDLNYDPDDTAMPQDASSRNNNSNDTNRSNGNICEGVATASANDSSSAAQKEAEKKEAEEEEDDLSLCIVCMTEKRNACLVHGKTSHQVGGGGLLICLNAFARRTSVGGECKGLISNFCQFFTRYAWTRFPFGMWLACIRGCCKLKRGNSDVSMSYDPPFQLCTRVYRVYYKKNLETLAKKNN